MDCIRDQSNSSILRLTVTLLLCVVTLEARTYHNRHWENKLIKKGYGTDNWVTKNHIGKLPYGKTKGCEKRFSVVSPKHTMCLNVHVKRKDGITETEKNLILERHNYYRANVEKFNNQPPATDMNKLVWDDQLSELAQKWASNCHYDHEESENRNIPGWASVGQNLGRGQRNWHQVMKMWHDEVNYFKYGRGSINGYETGHYTQMVWAASTRIGCGFAQCNGTKTFYVCNYAPSGNLRHKVKTPYKAGPTGSSCKKNFDSRSGLCDCGGKVCKNGGELDVSTCQCKCKDTWWIEKGGECDLDCSIAFDLNICASSGGKWGKRECQKFADVPYSFCPITCKLCPMYGDVYYGDPDATNKVTDYDYSNYDNYDYNYEEEQEVTNSAETKRKDDYFDNELPFDYDDSSDNDYKLLGQDHFEPQETTTTTTTTTTRPTTTTTTPTTTTTTPTTTTTTPTTTTTTPRTTTTTTRKTTTTTVAPKLPPSKERILQFSRPDLPSCLIVDPAMCGQPGYSFWPKDYCVYPSIRSTCPAMCKTCAARQCQDYHGKRYQVGESWANVHGQFTCTYTGVTVEKGCYNREKQRFIPKGGQYQDDDELCTCSWHSYLRCKTIT
ncbi:uncharacterized protein LOC106181113 isoform X2 [Lingula anatina]|nr:uncharacterized protein LOC106181113 isoform X2 [Lingula anatina]XP_013420854.1 uncharacterized protein LOC106181113 isoform X2 [Lingula anatina]XP_013420855.1 uncharacterized protein LOC106181113 isoform X2 [Lingula anatina]XP_013420857.1 uncharacterized protein LOC106181113 isoform X2 [Lingula anatina]|eukprot:XP_013420853.1 uncharacterized protein LOC106181113 isoform X2 [Lingula anatina]